MSTFSHINQALIFNDVAGTTVPPQWNHLVSHSLPTSTDASLEGVIRTIFHPSELTPRVQGELWKVTPTDHPKIFKITEGHLQLYVISGADSVTKNGRPMFIRPGEKVSFCGGDTFSFTCAAELRVFARNERAAISTTAPLAPLSQLRPPSDEQVESTKALLGLPSGSASRYEESSSRGYWRVRSRY